MGFAGLERIDLGPERLEGALALSTEAGWNQLAADWAFMLENGVAFGFVDRGGRLVASGLTVEFDRYGWVSMILVTPDWRRKGLATELMRLCVERLAARGLAPALDASPQGREVYRRIGFRDGGRITRLGGALERADWVSGATIEPLGFGALDEVADYDTASSGADRRILLGHLLERTPGNAFAARRGGRLAGFVMARDGRTCAQIGPLVADDEDVAAALLARAGGSLAGPFILDLFDDCAAIRARLDAAGFRPLTTFVRMVQGPAEIFPASHRTVVIGGPELS